jgi:hypothetical protein
VHGETSIATIVFIFGVTLMAIAIIVEVFNKGEKK